MSVTDQWPPFETRSLRRLDSVNRTDPVSYSVAQVAESMRAYADHLDPKDPWFFNERAGRRRIETCHREAERLTKGLPLEFGPDVANSPIYCGIARLDRLIREEVDLPEASRVWERDHPDDPHG